MSFRGAHSMEEILKGVACPEKQARGTWCNPPLRGVPVCFQVRMRLKVHGQHPVQMSRYSCLGTARPSEGRVVQWQRLRIWH